MTISTRAATRHRFSLRDLDNLRPDSPDALVDFCVSRLHSYGCDASQVVLVPPRSRISAVHITSRHRLRHGRLRLFDIDEVGFDGKYTPRLVAVCDAWDSRDVARLLIRRAIDADYLLAGQPLMAADGSGTVLRKCIEATAAMQSLFGDQVKAMRTDCVDDENATQLICDVFREELVT